jgi:hypothetical protein
MSCSRSNDLILEFVQEMLIKTEGRVFHFVAGNIIKKPLAASFFPTLFIGFVSWLRPADKAA